MKLVTYLDFLEGCEEAMNFYCYALEGEIISIMRYSDAEHMDVPAEYSQKILHAEMKVNEDYIFFSDVPDPTKLVKGNSMSITLLFDDISKMNTVFERLSEGGKVDMPITDMFWGGKLGSLDDKYGFQWSLHYSEKE